MIRGTFTNLRAVERSDLDRIHAWFDDPDLMFAWGYGAPVPSNSNTANRIETWISEELVFGHPTALMIETLERESVGLIVLSNLSPIDRHAELSILLDAHARGRGIGTDALESIVDAAFTQWNLHRLTIHCEAHNTIAQSFFVRQGFEMEGRLREARFLDGAWRDILVFGRLARDEEGSV